MTTSATSTQTRGMSRGLTLLFAIAASAAVGNLYWAQPLLNVIGEDFNVPTGSTGLIVTVTQIGYAVGVFLLLPLGDMVNRKFFIPGLMILTAVFLLATAAAPAYPVMLGTLALIGFSAVAGQFLIPLAGDLARDDQRGRVLGTVAAGIMIGLLIARALSGVVAEHFGWRAVFIMAAVIMVVLAAFLAPRIPTMEARPKVPYWRLLLAVVRTITGNRTVQVTMLIGASAMCVFTMFWTGMTFLLSSPSFGFSVSLIGAVSLVGVVGALAAQRVGVLFDRGLFIPALGVGLLITVVGLIVAAFGSESIIVLIIGAVIFGVGLQAVQILAQTRMLSIDASARSRLNTAFVFGNFVGGAIGSALAGAFWQLGGWVPVMIAASVVVALALLIWVISHKGALAR
ncbi:MFS transporter [Herbiconiux sp. CPCC 203407]|uniref:MFS transporter n=2 Tax=Herbiconiux oxytropis TaxID=2970915 RepID=A0AA41XIN1_9MICO|nr:MFS transporter [Herbiconiux oxytropis]MCS5721703.1 MFS transporter [Herbiconiux oxytropis]MCS5726670.1 MFS transporter [Herbiconiux oxytropis]